MPAKTVLIGLIAATALVLGAGHDDNVEWNGVSHVWWLDRSPLCPINGESFAVRFQTYHYDITSARVNVNAGAPAWVDAYFVENRGPYDVWTAQVPASSPTGTLTYYIELTDGTDTDYLGPAGMSDNPPADGWTLEFASLTHAPLGATLTSDGGAVFRVWAPAATSAYVAGQFNGWNSTSLPMSRSGAYFVRKVAAPVSANQKYKYIFQPGTIWKTDARGRAMDEADYGNTLIINPNAYAWSDAAFQTPAFEEMVIYELHVGTFSGRNDGLNRSGRYRDIVDTHLSHLEYLGVNVVQLMPITEFNYYESWGYNPIDHWAPENAYGSPADLKYTIDQLHAHGMAVVLDIVYNHFSGSGNYLWYYDGTQCYFDNPAVETPWGSQADFDRAEVADYFADDALYWLAEYHVDGFRMDATRYMRDNFIFPGGQPSGWGLMQRINWSVFNRKADAISIAEELPNEPMTTTPTTSGGAGFNSQWHMALRDNVRQAVVDAAYGNPNMGAVRDAINDATYPDKTRLVRYLESHDEAAQTRLARVIDNNDPYSVWAIGRSKLAQGLALLTAGIPMFLQGGEWLEDTAFGSGSANRIDWSKATSRAPIVQFFHDLIAVRKGNCGFRANAGYQVHHVDDTNNVIAFHRWCTDGNDLVVVANFNNSDLTGYRVGFPQNGTWHEILNSQALDYLGNGAGNGGAVVTEEVPWDGMAYSAAITAPQMGLLVFRFNQPPPTPGDLTCDGIVDFDDINPFVLAISDPAAYQLAYPTCNILNGDCNGDGLVNFDDINPFVVILSRN
jgi:1,4-alpha-glucan branching enzyme